MVPLISCWTFLCCYFFWSRRWLPLDLKPPSRYMNWLRPCRHSTRAWLRHLSECHLVHRHTHTQAAMASRKLLMGLTAKRRLQSRTQQLFWATSLPEATTSRSLMVAAAMARLSGRSPAAFLLSSRTISSTQPVTQSAGDVSGSGSSALEHKFVSLPCSLSTLIH